MTSCLTKLAPAPATCKVCGVRIRLNLDNVRALPVWFVLLASCASATAATPNIVLLMADDLGWGDVGFNGGRTIRTPHLDEVATDGLVLRRFYAASPVCSPTRGSCLTGRHPFRYGIHGANHGHLPAGERNLAEILQEQGYATGHFGKWHLGTLSRTVRDGRRGGKPETLAHYAPPWEHGFAACLSSEVQMPTRNPLVDQAFASRYWTGADAWQTDGMAGEDAKVIVDAAELFVSAATAAERPFFAVLWFHAPHLPVIGDPALMATYSEHDEEARHYYACVTALDEQIGRFRKLLVETGVEQETLIFFCSDNGPEGRTQAGRNAGSTGGLRGRKRSLYEGGVRVPAVAAWPGVIPAGGVSNVPATTSDYLPTICALLAVAPPSGPLDGVSLAPLLRGDDFQRAKPLCFRHGASRDATRGSPTLAIIDGDYKLLSDLDDGGNDELYDLMHDPNETRNLATNVEHQALAMKLRKELLRWRDEVDEDALD